MNSALTALSSIDALRWQLEMGIGECIEITPQFPWAITASALQTAFSHSSSAPVNISASDVDSIFNPGKPTQRPPSAAPSPSMAQAIADARSAADGANDLAALEAAVRAFDGCALKRTATNTVFAQGVPESRLMFIGEAPGADEDRQGVPFCGVSGQLLDKMLGFIGLRRAENFYITNCLFWRPPGNRKPTDEELAICRPFVEKHIALVNPKMLILVGGTATQAILNDSRGITRLRGQVFSYKNDYMPAPVPVHVIYHPSYLLRSPIEKKKAWADLLAIRAALQVLAQSY